MSCIFLQTRAIASKNRDSRYKFQLIEIEDSTSKFNVDNQDAGSIGAQQGFLKILSNYYQNSFPRMRRKSMRWRHSAIQLYLTSKVMWEVTDENIISDLWHKLESLYMTKSLTNKHYLKHCLFTLHMNESMPIKTT